MTYKVEKNLTKYNFTDKNDTNRIRYIVIHYFGSLGTAEAVANFFASKFVGASAHYSVDESDTVYQSVEDEDIAWHCGTKGKYYHPSCRNSNSIGIEVRPRKRNTASLLPTDTDWYFEPETIDTLVALTRDLMKKYKIPADRVLRHYDVTHKNCPNPFVIRSAEWVDFKNRLVSTPKPVVDSSIRVRIIADTLNVRGGPGAQYSVIGGLHKNEEVSIVDTLKGWGKLKNSNGWISMKYTLKI